jgi:hypothetical protein
MGYTGYPAHIFYGKLNYGFGGRSHYENMTILKKWWSDLASFLPVFYEKRKDEFKELELEELIDECFKEIEATHDLYRPDFEGLGSCSPEEIKFIHACDGVFYRLNKITAITHVIDGIEMDKNDEVIG